MSIKSIMDGLTPADRNKLMHAFQHAVPQYVELPGRRYVGVNTDSIPHLRPETRVGPWSEGELK